MKIPFFGETRLKMKKLGRGLSGGARPRFAWQNLNNKFNKISYESQEEKKEIRQKIN